jgi:hypothetical protein
MKPTLAAIAAALAIAAVPARARAVDSYLVLKGGYYWPTAEIAYAQAAGVKLDPKFTGAAGLGANLLFFGLEVTGGYLSSSNVLLKYSAVPVLATVKLRAPIVFVAPYLEVGGGAYFTSVTPVVGASEKKTGFGGHVGGGVDFTVSSIMVGVEARYLFMDPGFTLTNYAGLKLDGVTVTANVGFLL